MSNESFTSEPRSLHLHGATGAVRTEMLDGREHLVVPVIALMDTVIHAVNAATPERTPLAMLTKCASSFNGRPVVLGHPARNGRQISANEPGVLAAHGIGTIFNSRVENGKLQMEEWIDIAKAEKIAGPEFIADTRAAKSHEVSVGAFVVTDGKAGVHDNGKKYNASWTDATGDHLAVLLNTRGACSREMGCGSHRAAMHLVTAEGIELETLRDIPQSERDKMDESDFAGPHESFPIKTQADVDAAAKLIGHADDPEAVKSKIKSIAKRKGLSIPKAWRGASNPEGVNQYSGSGGNSGELIGRGVKVGTKVKIDMPHDRSIHGRTAVVTGKLPSGVVNIRRDDMRGAKPGLDQRHISVHHSALRHAELGEMMSTDKQSLRQRVMSLIRGAQEDPGEEAAELIQYKTIQSLLGQCSDCCGEAEDIVKELIAAEAEPTVTAEEEAAEEEIESARLEAINAHCMQMMGTLSGVMNVTRALLADDADSDYPRIMEAASQVRALIGKRHSTNDQQMIQTVHDHSVALGADCSANPDVRAMKAAADHNHESGDCTCSGNRAAEGDSDMTKVERVKALIAVKDSGYSDADAKWLEAVPDARLEALEVQAEGGLRAAATKADAEKVIKDKHTADTALMTHAAMLKAKEDKADGGADDAEEKKMKGAEAAKAEQLRAAAITASGKTPEQFDEDEWLKTAPKSLQAMVASKREADATRKDVLVSSLKAASSRLSEEQLKAKSLEDLEVLAAFAKVDEPAADFSGRGMPRAASDAKDVYLNPPDPYALAIAARNKSAVN